MGAKRYGERRTSVMETESPNTVIRADRQMYNTCKGMEKKYG